MEISCPHQYLAIDRSAEVRCNGQPWQSCIVQLSSHVSLERRPPRNEQEIRNSLCYRGMNATVAGLVVPTHLSQGAFYEQ